jgi:hypothetical protein
MLHPRPDRAAHRVDATWYLLALAVVVGALGAVLLVGVMQALPEPQPPAAELATVPAA